MKLLIDKQIVEIESVEMTVINDHFLQQNYTVIKINFPNVVHIKEMFLPNARVEDVNFPKLETAGGFFLMSSCMEKISLPNLKIIRPTFLHWNGYLKQMYLPKIKQVLHINEYQIPKHLFPRNRPMAELLQQQVIVNSKEYSEL